MIKPQSAPARVPIRYGWRGMEPADLPVIRGWVATPHRTRWWPNPDGALRTITRQLSKPGIECFTLTMDGRDVGFLQLYDPHQAPPPAQQEQTSGHAYRDQPRGTMPCAVTDRNARNFAAFHRTGLRYNGQQYTAWGHLRLMHRDNLKPTVSP